MTGSPLPVLAVRSGGLPIALPLEHIHIVHGTRHHAPPTPLPDSPPWLAGLIDGPTGLTPVVHLARLAGATGRQGDLRHARLIICRGRPPLAIQVDRADGLRHLTSGESSEEEPPSALAPFLESGWWLEATPFWLLRVEKLAAHVAGRT